MTSLENALRFFARTQTRPSLSNLWPQVFGDSRPFPQQVLEIRGPSKQAIKAVLMEILARMALPVTQNRRTTGRDGSILYFNFDGEHNPASFRNYLEKILSRHLREKLSLKRLVDCAVKNLIIIESGNIASNETEMKFEDLVLKKSDVGIVVIDCIDGYEPETTLKIPKENYLDKVSHLRLILSEINVLTIVLRKDTSDKPPAKEVFGDVNTVMIVKDYSDTGVKIHFCEEHRQHEIIFSDETMLHI